LFFSRGVRSGEVEAIAQPPVAEELNSRLAAAAEFPRRFSEPDQ
jgi:hypothetical protein